MRVSPNIKIIDIGAANEIQMKEILVREARELLGTGANFKIEASMAQHVMFKAAYGISMQKYVIDILKPQKPVHSKRKLF